MSVLDNSPRIEAQTRIDALFSPVGWLGFIEAYWDKQPMHLSGALEQPASIASPTDVRALVETGAPWQFRRVPEIYLDGGVVPHADIVREYVDMDGRVARAANLARIRNLLKVGATFNTFGQEHHFPRLLELKRAFGLAFAAEVEVAFFYSQQNHQGLSPHYDCVEIFAFQLHGVKRWQVSSQRVENPLVGYGTATAYDLAAPHAEIDLEPGDLLFLPRGTFHHALALTPESLHATLAVKVPTILEALQLLLKVASDHPGMRDYLPISNGSWSQAIPAAIDRLRELSVESEIALGLGDLLNVAVPKEPARHA